jgi:hypothetical protein
MVGAALMAVAGLVQAQSFDETKPFPADGRVAIDNLAGSVRVEGWDRDEIRVEGELGRGVERIDFEVDGERASIEVVIPRRARNVGGTDLQVWVPRGCQLLVKSVSASIEVTDIEGELDLHSVSGDISLRARTTRVRAQSVSGDLEVDGDPEDLELESVSGDIVVLRARGEVRANTVSGTVEIGPDVEALEGYYQSVSGDVEFEGMVASDGRYEFESHSGSVRILLSREVSADVEVSTFSGSIRNELGPEPQRKGRYGPGEEVHFTLGDGDAEVQVSSFSGGISILER